jgi:predicted transcriptional regulator
MLGRMTQTDAAKLLKMKQPTISAFLSGTQGTSPAKAILVCQEEGEDPAALLGWSSLSRSAAELLAEDAVQEAIEDLKQSSGKSEAYLCSIVAGQTAPEYRHRPAVFWRGFLTNELFWRSRGSADEDEVDVDEPPEPPKPARQDGAGARQPTLPRATAEPPAHSSSPHDAGKRREPKAAKKPERANKNPRRAG